MGCDFPWSHRVSGTAVTAPKSPQPDLAARSTIQEYLMGSENQCFHFGKWNPGLIKESETPGLEKAGSPGMIR